MRRLVVSAQWRFLIDERRSAKVFVSHVVFSASTSVLSCSRLRYIGSRHFLVYFCLSYRYRPMPLRRHLFLGMFLNAFLIGTGVVSMGLLTATFKLPPTVLFAQADIE